MKSIASNVFLFLVGVLVSVPLFAKTVTLNENNYVALVGPVSDQSVAEVSQQLGQLSARLSSNDTIYLVIDSPGGSVMAGSQLIDFANSLPQKIKPICLFCASMGYHLFQSFDQRLVRSSSTLMSHRASLGGVSGQIPGELITRINQIMEFLNEMDGRVSKRVGLSRQDYQALIYNELWLSGEKAVATNHADKLVNINCAKSLISDLDKKEVQTMFGLYEVEVSKCPLIAGVFSFKRIDRKGFTQTFQVPKNEQEILQEIRRVQRNVTMEF